MTTGRAPIEFTLIRSKRRTLTIRVQPDGTIEVLAPLRAPLPWIRAVVDDRAEWIEKQVERLASFRREHPAPQYVAGERHAYLGRQYELAFEPAHRLSVTLSGDRLLLQGPGLPDPDAAKRLLGRWLAGESRRIFSERLERCLHLFPDPPRVRPERVTIRAMKSRWGSMSSAGRMSINSRLIHAPLECIDYVIVHELCHRLQPNHSPRFWQLVAGIIPDYKSLRARLRQEAWPGR